MGTLVDLTARLKNRRKISEKKLSECAGVYNLLPLKQEVITEERRNVRRTILTEFIGTHIVLPMGLVKVSLYDISTEGVSFDLEQKMGQFKSGEEVSMRIYLNQEAYFPFQIKVSNIREDEEEGVYRHGASFVKGSINEEALFHFIKFLESVSMSLKKDKGEILVSNLRG